jgi:hypothetical protein
MGSKIKAAIVWSSAILVATLVTTALQYRKNVLQMSEHSACDSQVAQLLSVEFNGRGHTYMGLLVATRFWPRPNAFQLWRTQISARFLFSQAEIVQFICVNAFGREGLERLSVSMFSKQVGELSLLEKNALVQAIRNPQFRPIGNK